MNNYSKDFAFASKNNIEEKYALITHSIQLEGLEEGNNYRDHLRLQGCDIGQIPQKAVFNREKHIVLEPGDTTFTFIDLFAGIGGFRIAMQEVGGRCVFSSEWDESAKETYYNNYGEVPFGDITRQDIKDLIPGYFDILCAGFPCQPFSNAGLKRGIEDTRGTLFYHIADILQTRQPRAVLLENVKGLISNDRGNTIRTVLRTITEMGYRCNISQELINEGSIGTLQKECAKMVLSAKDYGVPQNRPRIYIVLWRDDIPVESFKYPVQEGTETRVGDILEANVGIEYTISDRLWEGHQRRRREHAEKGNGFGYCLFNADSEYTSTISRRYYKDGSEILIEQPGRNPRKITPREAANLQGFPTEFRIPDSKTKAYQQFGNSIAVPVVTRIAAQMVEQILEA